MWTVLGATDELCGYEKLSRLDWQHASFERLPRPLLVESALGGPIGFVSRRD